MKNSDFSTQHTTMEILSTAVIIHMNMGFMDGEETIRFTETDARANLAELTQHMRDIIPDVDDLDTDDCGSIEKISVDAVEVGGDWSVMDETLSTTAYTIKLTVTIHHGSAITLANVNAVVDAIYENGANFSFTPDSCAEDGNANDAMPQAMQAMPQTVLYPYHSIIADLSH
jgi:hypothetical protein